MTPSEDPTAPGSFFVIQGRDACWWVSTRMAQAVENELARHPRPGWITFVDLAGSRVRVAAKTIEYVEQSTPEQRDLRRTLWRALAEERRQWSPGFE